MSDDLAAAAAPPLSPESLPGHTPLCYIVDEESSIRQFLSLVLHGAGVDAIEFADGGSMRAAAAKRTPDLVFLNISLESTDAIESVIALARHAFNGSIQLMSNRGSAVLEHVKNIGIQNRLAMLPVLKKPFETDAVLKVLQQLKLGIRNQENARVDLSEALAKNWIEFWYQPKIDIRRKQLAGAEAFARVNHPEQGILPPAAFMSGAKEEDVIKLSEMAILDALRAGSKFAEMGIQLRIAVNVPIAALVKLPVTEIVGSKRQPGDKWPGLIIDIPEDQIINDIPLANELTKQFAPANVRLAVDDFGRAYAALTKIKEMPFVELKLDRTFVVDCGHHKSNAPMCKTVIDLAHSFGSVAVAVGIEKASDAVALVSMGCDYGQGFLLGQPMPDERLISLLRQRAVGRKSQPQAPEAPPQAQEAQPQAQETQPA
jgi:EAL domain-containing protein (putative c-di-GMP-specific phosphodiesterase class I)/CheY-like chemotaxis protein